MSSLKSLVGKQQTQSVKFLGESFQISKLSVSQVLKIQEIMQPGEDGESSETAGLDMMVEVIRMALPEAEELSNEDFREFPLDALQELTEKIMNFSGMGEKGK
ncbi:hypothetical protein N9112_00130 [bacterium]|nr:hypothetical protein [bacterium]